MAPVCGTGERDSISRGSTSTEVWYLPLSNRRVGYLWGHLCQLISMISIFVDCLAESGAALGRDDVAVFDVPQHPMWVNQAAVDAGGDVRVALDHRAVGREQQHEALRYCEGGAHVGASSHADIATGAIGRASSRIASAYCRISHCACGSQRSVRKWNSILRLVFQNMWL